MNVVIASTSNLFLEALQQAVHCHRPKWKVETHLIQGSTFTHILMQKITGKQIEMIVIEMSNYQHFATTINSLKRYSNEMVNILLLVDSEVGEVYQHLSNEEKWIGIHKNISVDTFITLLENFTSNVSVQTEVSLTDRDKNVLKGLANGHTFEFLQHTYNLSIDELERSIFSLNAYFKVPNYIEAVQKAIDYKVIKV